MIKESCSKFVIKKLLFCIKNNNYKYKLIKIIENNLLKLNNEHLKMFWKEAIEKVTNSTFLLKTDILNNNNYESINNSKINIYKFIDNNNSIKNNTNLCSSNNFDNNFNVDKLNNYQNNHLYKNNRITVYYNNNNKTNQYYNWNSMKEYELHNPDVLCYPNHLIKNNCNYNNQFFDRYYNNNNINVNYDNSEINKLNMILNNNYFNFKKNTLNNLQNKSIAINYNYVNNNNYDEFRISNSNYKKNSVDYEQNNYQYKHIASIDINKKENQTKSLISLAYNEKNVNNIDTNTILNKVNQNIQRNNINICSKFENSNHKK